MSFHFATPQYQDLNCVALHICGWITCRHRDLAAQHIYMILRDAIACDDLWYRSLYCVELDKQRVCFFKLRTCYDRPPLYTRLRFWIKRLPLISAVHAKRSLRPLWSKTYSGGVTLEYMFGCRRGTTEFTEFPRKKILKTAIREVILQGADSLSCHISKYDLQGAALCRGMGFTLHAPSYHHWYPMDLSLATRRTEFADTSDI